MSTHVCGTATLDDSILSEPMSEADLSLSHEEDNLLTLQGTSLIAGQDAEMDQGSACSSGSPSEQSLGEEVMSLDEEHTSHDESGMHNQLDNMEGEVYVDDEVSQPWCGFKLVGDNIDKNVHPRHETIERRSQSLHYFNVYAVLDRVDLSSFSDSFPRVDINSLPLQDLLPSPTNFSSLCSNFAVLVGRVLTENLKSFSVFADVIPAHIEHHHQELMCKKSEVVSLNNFYKMYHLYCIFADTSRCIFKK